MQPASQYAVPIYDYSDINKDSNRSSEKKESNSNPITYQIKVSYRFMKYPLFTFLNGNNILFTAKHQNNEFFIGKGFEVHVNKETNNQVGKILEEHDRVNSILANGNRFKLKYIESEKPNRFMISVSFRNNGEKVEWKPKKNINRKNNPELKLKSKRDFVLENSERKTVFVFRKKSNDLFEIETVQSIDPLIIFTIGLSAIIGPHDGPFGGF